MNIVEWFTESYSGISMLTFFVSMLPVMELRFAIPLGTGLGLNMWHCYLLSVLGNILPVPFIIVFIRRILAWLQTKSKLLDGLIRKKVDKTMKHEKLVYGSQIIGLIIFVAIPLPGTGAWTGALLAALLDIRLKTAFPSILTGVIVAGIVVTGLTRGFIAVFI